MSFLLDPPALVIIGVVIDRYIDARSRRNRLAAGVVAMFVVVSTLLYLDVLPWWFGEWMSGSDWMLNSGFDTDLTREPGTDVLAVVLFASYPLWMRLGLDVGERYR
ncbi:MAG: hypothetical protein ACLFNC_05640 [Halodesulfurarchaeum sp.]